jgi:hypothetical protein
MRRIEVVNYSAYLQSAHWKQVRRKWYMTYPNRVCEACCKPMGKGRTFDLHHISYDSLGTARLRDLILLCRSCHERIHRLKKAYPEHTLKSATFRVISDAHRRIAMNYTDPTDENVESYL